MNKRHLKNLSKLADFIENHVTDEQFDMASFRNEDFKSRTDCGTVGSALGWAPLAFPKVRLVYDSFYCGKYLDFDELSERLFGVCLDRNWRYLFSKLWAKTTCNTRQHFVKRARAFVEAGGDLTKVTEQGTELYR